jgi:hypothetical protein
MASAAVMRLRPADPSHAASLSDAQRPLHWLSSAAGPPGCQPHYIGDGCAIIAFLYAISGYVWTNYIRDRLILISRARSDREILRIARSVRDLTKMRSAVFSASLQMRVTMLAVQGFALMMLSMIILMSCFLFIGLSERIGPPGSSSFGNLINTADLFGSLVRVMFGFGFPIVSVVTTYRGRQRLTAARVIASATRNPEKFVQKAAARIDNLIGEMKGASDKAISARTFVTETLAGFQLSMADKVPMVARITD